MTATWASAFEHRRYSVRRENRRTGPRRCPLGWPERCPNPSTHRGDANGMCLTMGCEFHVAQWVRDPLWRLRRRAARG